VSMLPTLADVQVLARARVQLVARHRDSLNSLLNRQTDRQMPAVASLICSSSAGPQSKVHVHS